MLIFPAIDIMDGKCVRLHQGRADTQTVYSDEPTEVACRWQADGAEYLHLVDLDGAFEGSMKNMESFREIDTDASVALACLATLVTASWIMR